MEKLESVLNEILKTGKGESILLELDTESYLETIIKTIKKLQKKGLSGVYVSIQRPFKNISSLLKKEGVDLNKIIFIDVASAVSKETQEKRKGCVHISPGLDVDELVKAIYTSTEKLKGKKFIFIDSLTTFALYKPISETLRFSEFLMRAVKDEKNMILILILNVAKDLSHKKFIQDVVVHADKIIEVKI
ncbi:MAG: ATPase domain-containing protein [Candidatus Diapherotrites archaeon]